MNLHVPSPAEITARRARLMGSGRIVNLAVKPKEQQPKRPDSPADAHVKAYEAYMTQVAECPSPAAYVRMRCKVLGLPYDDIMSASRKRKVVAARFQMIWEVRRRFPHLSTPQIGKLFGRDHTSIVWALSKQGLLPGHRVTTDEKIAEIRRLYSDGLCISHVAKQAGVGADTVRRYVIPGYSEALRKRKAESRARLRAKARSSAAGGAGQ